MNNDIKSTNLRHRNWKFLEQRYHPHGEGVVVNPLTHDDDEVVGSVKYPFVFAGNKPTQYSEVSITVGMIRKAAEAMQHLENIQMVLDGELTVER